jgi:hypothetical protein
VAGLGLAAFGAAVGVLRSEMKAGGCGSSAQPTLPAERNAITPGSARSILAFMAWSLISGPSDTDRPPVRRGRSRAVRNYGDRRGHAEGTCGR